MPRPEGAQWVRLVPVLVEDFDEDPKADEHLMARIESVGCLTVETNYTDAAKVGARTRHG